MKIDYYEKILNESQERFSKTVKDTLSVLTKENQYNKGNAVKLLKEETERYLYLLSKENYPIWLMEIKESLKEIKYSANDKGSLVDCGSLIEALIKNAKEIYSFVWHDDEISFEDIYMKYRTQYKLKELFDKIINLLYDIINSNQINDQYILKSLNKIITFIKVNNVRSCFSDIYIIEYLKIFSTNLLKNLLKIIPGLGIIIQSIEDTTEEVQEKFELVQKDTYTEINGNMEVSKNLLPDNAELLKSLTYDFSKPKKLAITDNTKYLPDNN